MFIKGASNTILILDWVWTLLPMIVIFTIVRLRCPIQPSKSIALDKIKPPNWSFKYIWIMISMLIGLAWTFDTRDNDFNVRIMSHYIKTCILYGLLILALILWPIAYSHECINSPKYALYAFFCILTTLFMVYSQSNNVSSLLLSPVLAWILYAFAMTFVAVIAST